MDGVDGADAVVVGADEVGADAAVVGECGEGVPVAGDGLMSFGAFEGLFTGVVGPGHGEVAGEGPDLVLLWRRVARLYPGWLPLGQWRCWLVVIPQATAWS